MATKKIDINDLQPNPDNPRTITKEEFERLKNKISRNPDGLKANKIVHENGKIIAGNQRFRALQELGLEIKDEYLLDASGWTKEQIREYLIISNVSDGEWDWDMLANEWDADELIEWGVDMPEEWGTPKELPEDIDEIPIPPKTPVSKLGDLWLLGNHRVLCGDSTDQATVERLMDGKKADMVFTDPPYGVAIVGGTHNFGHKKFQSGKSIQNDELDGDKLGILLNEVFPLVAKNVKPGASIYVTHADTFGHIFRQAVIEAGFKIASCIIWVKHAFVFGRSDYKWQHEPILFGWLEGAAHTWSGATNESTVWNYDRPSPTDKTQHPTIKPVELVSRAIANSSNKKESVLDVFLGSGSTLIACEQTDRICYGLELDPQYIDVICKRWQTLTGQQPVLEATGEPYDFCS